MKKKRLVTEINRPRVLNFLLGQMLFYSKTVLPVKPAIQMFLSKENKTSLPLVEVFFIVSNYVSDIVAHFFLLLLFLCI